MTEQDQTQATSEAADQLKDALTEANGHPMVPTCVREALRLLAGEAGVTLDTTTKEA